MPDSRAACAGEGSKPLAKSSAHCSPSRSKTPAAPSSSGGQNSRRRNPAAGQSNNRCVSAPRAPHLAQMGCTALPSAC
eukprot:4685815-Pyramimonas_sp.AAC.1